MMMPTSHVSRAWFEEGLRYLLAFAFGMGSATIIYNVPELKASKEFVGHAIHGDYPGLSIVQGPQCTPLDPELAKLHGVQ